MHIVGSAPAHLPETHGLYCIVCVCIVLCRGPAEADELLARADFVKNVAYDWKEPGGSKL